METKENLQKIIQEAEEAKKLQDSIIKKAKKELEEVGKKKIRPCYGERFLFLEETGLTVSATWGYSMKNTSVWEAGNGFFTEEEARKEREKRQAIQRVKDYLIENDLLCSEEEVNSEGFVKYYIRYDTKNKELVLGHFFYQKYYSPFGYSRNEQFLEDCKEDLLLIFG